jgi:hypothetical protein
VLNIVPLSITDNIGHYRFLALPLGLFCIAAALIRFDGTRMIGRKTWGVLKIGLVAAWTAGAMATSKSIVPLWNNSESLWSWTYTQHPESRMAGAQYAAAALRMNRPKTARKVLDNIRARHGGFTFHEQLFYAECLLRTDNLEEATKYLHGITDALPQYHAWPDSAAARRELQTTSAAEVLASAFWHLAVAGAVEGRGDDARRFARIAIWYQPGNPQLMMAGALFMQRFGQPDEAKRMRGEVREMVGSSALPAIDDAVRQSLMTYSALAVWFTNSATAPEGGT